MAALVSLTLLTSTLAQANEHGLGIRVTSLSIHPYDQGWWVRSGYYPLAFDPAGVLILTPGLSINYDLPVPTQRLQALRFTLQFGADCAVLPSGFGAVSWLLPPINAGIMTVQFGLGFGFYWRLAWNQVLTPGYRVPIVMDCGPIECMPIPYPEVEFRFGDDTLPVEFVIHVIPGVLINQVSLGIHLKFGHELVATHTESAARQL